MLTLTAASCMFNDVAPETVNVVDKNLPNTPDPPDQSTNRPIATFLKWQSADSLFDVYFDYSYPPKQLVASKIKRKEYLVYGLSVSTSYYWKVIAFDANGVSKEGPIWSFTTSSTSTTTNPLLGYALQLKKQQVKLPNNVNFLFRVVDMQNKSVTNLQPKDFSFFEDGYDLSSESFVEFKKVPQLPYKIRTVLMLDNSSSLNTTDLAEIKKAATSYVNKLTAFQEVAIYQFSEIPQLLIDFTKDKVALTAALNNYAAGKSTTALFDATIEGASRWEDVYEADSVFTGNMIILTDGNETAKPNSFALSQALYSVRNKKVFTIGLRGKDDLDEETLRMIGNSGYYPIDNVGQLDAKFAEIQKTIVDFANSFYNLTYKSPRRGNNDYNIMILIKNNPYTGDNSYILGKYNSTGFYSQ